MPPRLDPVLELRRRDVLVAARLAGWATLKITLHTEGALQARGAQVEDAGRGVSIERLGATPERALVLLAEDLERQAEDAGVPIPHDGELSRRRVGSSWRYRLVVDACSFEMEGRVGISGRVVGYLSWGPRAHPVRSAARLTDWLEWREGADLVDAGGRERRDPLVRVQTPDCDSDPPLDHICEIDARRLVDIATVSPPDCDDVRGAA